MNKSVKRLVLILVAILISILSFSLGRNSTFRKADISQTNEIETDESDRSDKTNDPRFKTVNQNIISLYNRINKDFLFDFDEEKAEEGIYKGILESLDDPYSVYYNEKEFKELNEHTSGEFGGIGIQVSPANGDLIEVISPIKDTPGEKAGIQSGDKILEINGEAFFSKDLDKAVGVMRGEPGTTVNLKIKRGEGESSEIIDLTIERAIISVDSVFPKMLENNMGYILLTGFQEHTGRDFIKAYEQLKNEGATSIILDLRNNPGGLLESCMQIADYLMDKGTVINVRYKDGSSDTYETEDGSDKLPLVTLINEGSASASEVLSGALQDHKRSEIVGKTSYGKGIIQNVYPINMNGKAEGMKLTIAEFYTPNNNQIHGVGIKPDYEVEIPEDVKNIGVENLENDTQLQKAIELLNK